MEAISARAALVTAPDVGEGLTTSVTREEVQQALDGDDALELVLDVTRFSEGEPAETRNIAVAWDRDDLAKILRDADGDRILLNFDSGTLAEAMEKDVEAHGLREKVLVLAVAATAASGTAAAAATEPGPYLGAGVAAVETTLGPDDRAVSRATPEPEPVLGSDDRAVSRATPASEPTMGPDDRAVSRAVPTPESSLGVDDRFVSRSTPVTEPTLSVDDRTVPRGTSEFVTSEPGVAADDSGAWAPTPAETVAIGGAVALAITGAAFLVAGRRRPGVRPA